MTERRRDRLNELEELFADLWQVPRFAAALRHGFRPQLDCFRTEDPPEVVVVVELAGADPDQLRIEAVARTLVISGVRPRPRCEGGIFYRSEIEYGRYHREVELGVDVDLENATATYERGLLRIVLPVAEKPRGPVKVPIALRRSP